MTPVHAHMPVELIIREGALADCGARAASYGKRCLIMTSGSAAEKSGALADALAAMKAAKVEATVFPHIDPNPTLLQCRYAAQAAEAARVHSILAIGGGSVMDAAKATAIMATHFMPDPNAIFEKRFKHEPLPLMLCGTTAGTGSEVSAVAVLTDQNGKKRSVKHPALYAKCAFCDPRYTDSMPRDTTVSTALDALAHAVEGYLNPACDTVSTMFAEQALTLLADGLQYLCDNALPDNATRDKLFCGSLYAGMVLNECGTAFPHPLGYVLTEDFGIPHGQACAVFLPALIACAEEHTPARAAALHALFDGRLLSLLETLIDAPVAMTEEQLAAYAIRFADLPHYAHVPGGFDGTRAVALCRTLFR